MPMCCVNSFILFFHGSKTCSSWPVAHDKLDILRGWVARQPHILTIAKLLVFTSSLICRLITSTTEPMVGRNLPHSHSSGGCGGPIAALCLLLSDLDWGHHSPGSDHSNQPLHRLSARSPA